jgi:hypothetical protein
MFKKKGIVLFALILFFGAICFGSVAIAQVCEGDFNNDGRVLYDDLITFAADYARTDCPPPIAPPAPVEKTGQTICYDSSGISISCAGTGQDGEYKKGVAWPNPRFTDNSDGTVTDNLTGLIWLKNADCYGLQTWADALTYCNDLASGDCELSDGSIAGDWRLPNIKELHSLIDFSQANPALPFDCPSVSSVQFDYGYWSSTTLASFTLSAWNVQMYNGNVNGSNKGNNKYVWPVRNGN